jgi:TPR repeat protein
MPKVIYFADPSNRHPGLGATIRLDSGEPCLISIAQGGVRVRKSRHGWLGPVLYDEKVVYKAASTAQALSLLFPDSLLPSGFTNPVLSSFANAVLHCSTCAEVAIVLNEAIPRGEAQADSDDTIVADLAALMANGELKADAFYDVSVLPHPKEEILMALEREILREPSDARVEWLEVAATFLLSFQEGIGQKPLFWLGVDITELRQTTKNLKEQARSLANNNDRKRAEQFLAIMKTESDQIRNRMGASVRLRSERLAHQGNADAQVNLGIMYGSGQGVPQDYAAAAGWFRKAAEQGNANGQYNLGIIYDKGQGVPQDYAAAAGWFRKAAEQGSANAQFNLGSMYLRGQGVTGDYVKAANWYRKAAEQGDAKSQGQLGLMYAGGEGVPQDYAAAMHWCRQAADKGIVAAQWQLGTLYANGQGVAQDFDEAARWSRKAADRGYAKAQLLLGALYNNGEGVPKDYVQSYKWLTLAASRAPASQTNNDNKAASLRDFVATKLTPTEIAEAQKLASLFKAAA